MRFSEVYEKHPQRFDTIETRPVTPIFISILVKDTIILKHVKFYEDDMRESDSNVSL